MLAYSRYQIKNKIVDILPHIPSIDRKTSLPIQRDTSVGPRHQQIIACVPKPYSGQLPHDSSYYPL